MSEIPLQNDLRLMRTGRTCETTCWWNDQSPWKYSVVGCSEVDPVEMVILFPTG